MGYQAAMGLSRSIAAVLKAAGILALGLIALPFVVLFSIMIAGVKLVDWIDLHVSFGGDSVQRDKSRWRDS